MSHKSRRRRLRVKHARDVQQAKAAEITRVRLAKAAEAARKRRIFPFLKLPGELRNQIYIEAILDDADGYDPIYLTRYPGFRGAPLVHYTDDKWYRCASSQGMLDNIIFKTLRPWKDLRHSNCQIYREMTSLGISQTWLYVCDLDYFIDGIQDDSRFKALRQLELDLGSVMFEDLYRVQRASPMMEMKKATYTDYNGRRQSIEEAMR
ncbi:MAG: hypothetical protein M1836_004451 [Candelina mexicana]|nr:MAG: hypothetical protein M1836_004451 [Candelina mexicana]